MGLKPKDFRRVVQERMVELIPEGWGPSTSKIVNLLTDAKVRAAGDNLFSDHAKEVAQNVLDLLLLLGDSLQEADGEPPPSLPLLPEEHTHGSRALSDALANDLEPWVEHWRERLRPHVPDGVLPLPAFSDAVHWLRGFDGRDSPGISLDPSYQKLLENPPPGVEVKVRVLTLPVPNTNTGWMEHMVVPWESPLAPLVAEVERYSEKTHLSPWSLLAFVLLGWRPRLPALRTKWNLLPGGGGTPGEPGYCQVTFFTPELSKRQIWDLYTEIRRVWSFHGKKAMTAWERSILQIVDEMGGPPRIRGQKEEFWRRTAERMAEETDRPADVSRESTLMLWQNAHQKLEAILGRGQVRGERTPEEENDNV